MDRRVLTDALVSVGILIFAVLEWPRKSYTLGEQRAALAAKAASIKVGWWGDGYGVQSITRDSVLKNDRWEPGWFVGIDHPGNYAGGHHGVMLDRNYHLVRFIGGK